MPRVDPETGYGLVSDVCIKRKIRNYMETVKENAQNFDIYIKNEIPLNASDKRAYLAVLGSEKLDKKTPEIDLKLRDWMCYNFYDVRTFGAVMTTFVKDKLNCGQVRGPVQIGFARSIDPIVRQEVSITRIATTTEKDFAENKNTEMGRKHIIPYALYRCDGFISANLARRVTHLEGEKRGNVLLRREQYRIANNAERSLKAAVNMVSAKTMNSRSVF